MFQNVCESAVTAGQSIHAQVTKTSSDDAGDGDNADNNGDDAVFPDLNHLRTCLVVKFVQIVFTSIGQSMILDFQKDSTDSAFLALLYLNILFSGLTFVFRASELILKWGVLAGSDLSNDVSAAREGHEIDRTSRSGLEIGTIYTDNPMHGERQMDSNINSSVHTSDESLLLLKEKVERKFEEQQSQITELQSQIEKLLKNNEEF